MGDYTKEMRVRILRKISERKPGTSPTFTENELSAIFTMME